MTCTTCQSPAVIVEVLHVRHDPHEGWFYRRTHTQHPAHAHPDATARRLAGLARPGHTGVARSFEPGAFIPSGRGRRPSPVLHSTSWRHEAEGLILTYVHLPDSETHQPFTPLATLRTAHGSHPAAPAPAALTVENVVAHGLRHFALLLRTDPIVRNALAEIAGPALLSALAGLDPLPAGSSRSL